MFRLWILILLAFTASAAVPAQRKNIGPSDSDQKYAVEAYLEGICLENYNWTEPSRPCEVATAIDYQCVTGLDWDPDSDAAGQLQPECCETQDCQSPDFQRTCYCQSQYSDSLLGCYSCDLEHGGDGFDILNSFDWARMLEIMDEYCDPMASPTADFAYYILPAFLAVEYAYSTSFADPLGFKKTEVSLYYTPSITGVEAWSTSLSTIEDWNDGYIDAYITADSSDTSSVTADTDDTTSPTSFSTTVSSGTTTSFGTATSSSTTASSSTTTSFNPPTQPHPTSDSSVVSTADSTVITGSTHSPSLFSITNASRKNGVGGIFGFLSFMAMVALL
jgi:hypothetical protein